MTNFNVDYRKLYPSLTKNVNGEDIELTADEYEQVITQWEQNQAAEAARLAAEAEAKAAEEAAKQQAFNDAVAQAVAAALAAQNSTEVNN